MAFVSNNQNEDDEKTASQGPVSPGASGGTQLAPSSGVGSAGGPSGSSTPQGTGAGGQFATLNQYVSANQGAAAPLADKITGQIGDQFNTLQGQNTVTLNGIQNDVNSGYTKQNQDILNQEASDPVSFAANPGNIASFQGQLNDKYTGPTSTAGDSRYQNQVANINNAVSTGQAQTGSDAGRQQLLSQFETAPSASVTGLNSAILAQDPNSQGKIEGAYKPFSGLSDQLTSGAGDIDKSIASAGSEAANASSASQKQLSDQFNGLNTAVNNQYTTAQNATNQYNQGLQGYQTAAAANQPLSADLDSSGLLPLLGVSNPFSQTYTAMNAPTINTTATQQQLDTQTALNQLGGTSTNTIDPNVAVGGYTAPGTLPTTPDIGQFLDQLTKAEYGNVSSLLPNGANDPVAISKLLNMAGAPNGSGGNPIKNYDTQVAPYQKLMQQLNELYGNQYTQPGTYNGNPLPGTYTLKS